MELSFCFSFNGPFRIALTSGVLFEISPAFHRIAWSLAYEDEHYERTHTIIALKKWSSGSDDFYTYGRFVIEVAGYTWRILKYTKPSSLLIITTRLLRLLVNPDFLYELFATTYIRIHNYKGENSPTLDEGILPRWSYIHRACKRPRARVLMPGCRMGRVTRIECRQLSATC